MHLIFNSSPLIDSLLLSRGKIFMNFMYHHYTHRGGGGNKN